MFSVSPETVRLTLFFFFFCLTIAGGFLAFQAMYPALVESKANNSYRCTALTSLSQPCLPVSNVGPTRILPFLYLGSSQDALSLETAQVNSYTPTPLLPFVLLCFVCVCVFELDCMKARFLSFSKTCSYGGTKQLLPGLRNERHSRHYVAAAGIHCFLLSCSCWPVKWIWLRYNVLLKFPGLSFHYVVICFYHFWPNYMPDLCFLTTPTCTLPVIIW